MTTATQEKDNTAGPPEAAPALPSAPELPSASVPAADVPAVANKPRRRRIVRRRRGANKGSTSTTQPVLETAVLEALLRESSLPPSYNFEIAKTVEKIVSLHATHVALQMPEGLLLYATVLADLLQRCLAQSTTTTPQPLKVSVLGDVTYGACCVDDLGAKALGAQLLVHYGHSCLVPIQHSVLPCLYVFVELQMDVPHLVECIHATLSETTTTTTTTQPSISLLGTIQFRQGLVEAKRLLLESNDEDDYKYTGDVVIPQAKPLSPGEVLGCTSPRVTTDVVVFCADGRFHLESTMIANPQCRLFLRYDPYAKKLTRESFQHDKLHALRKSAIANAKSARTFGIILGTLGRQGNPAILKRIQSLLTKHGRRSFILLLSEISPAKLSLFATAAGGQKSSITSSSSTTTPSTAGVVVDAWIQVACPRLSVDWGHYFPHNVPILSPYEVFVCLDDKTQYQDVSPMDFYSNQGGPWSNYYETNKERKCRCDDADQDQGSAVACRGK